MYGFTLSNVETADGSSFQCIQHTGQRSLKSLGHMHMKMQIHANEDSYENTKCKMAAVEQEQKSFCTKVIKTNGSHLSCKIKKFKHPGSMFPPKITPLTKTQDQTIFLKPKGKTGNPALLQEPIRKRIIHILALKPYKKPDVLLRLIKEGISDENRKSFPQILNQVGSVKGNMYTLSNQLWKEVEDNWKFCTKEELEVICRRKQQYLKSSNEMKDVSQNSIQKHVENEPVYKEPQNKKPRISHYNNNKVPDQTVKAIFSVGSAKSNKSTSIKFKASIVGNSQKVLLSNQVNGHSNGIGEPNGKYSKKDPSAHHTLSRSNMMECNGSSQASRPRDCISEFHDSDHQTGDHVQKYKLASKEQRTQFTIDFNSQYTEYLKLHTKMKEISEKLTSLENHLCNCEENSEDFKKTRLEIRKLYKTTIQSNQYKKDWERFNTLQSKLSHIKSLIVEYDSAEL